MKEKEIKKSYFKEEKIINSKKIKKKSLKEKLFYSL